MLIKITKKKSCSDSRKCSDNILNELEEEFSCKLMARTNNDIVNGSVSILHTPNNHDIRIEFYDKNEEPNSEHKTTLKKLGKIPTESEIKKII